MADIERVVRLALAEDGAGDDVTTTATVPVEQLCTGAFVAREPGTVAGLPVVAAVFALHAPSVKVDLKVSDGARVAPGDTVAVIDGPTRDVLTVERTALNLLCHLSGVASLTAKWIAAVEGIGATIRDTRKTTPGLRALEKYAVRCGGGSNHRLSLTDQALIKDNHVIAAGGVTAAIEAVRRDHPGLVCEVECDTVEQVREALAAGAALVLLDNMTLDETRESVRFARDAGAATEASGGLTIERAREVAETGVDYLAVGALTHSAPALDIGLDLTVTR